MKSLAIVLLLALLPRIALAIVPALPADDFEELRREIRRILSETHTAGAALGLIEDGRTTWVASFGYADLHREIHVHVHTPFRLGSISKTFVAMSVLKLVEQGKLRLDQKVAELAPEIRIENPWEGSDPVRVVHLLEHTAGFDDFHLCEYAHSDSRLIPLEEALAFNPRSRRVRWRPGTQFSYTNGGPPVAARLVEKITGMRYEDYVRKTFFEPLEMRHASF